MFVIVGIIAIYLFFQVKALNNKLEANQQTIDFTEKQNRIYQSISSADSLLVESNYQEALNRYETQLTSGSEMQKRLITQRIKLTKQLIQQHAIRSINKIDTATQLRADTVEISREATPAELRQYDSMNFALAKAQAHIENLKLQLKQQHAGTYLTFTTTKGSKAHYVGEVKNGRAHGEGIGLLKSGSRYEGEWENNMRHGKGSFYWPDGEYYIGEYKNDKRHGQGTYYWTNGEKYVGGWANDQRSGHGTFLSKDGEIVAQGIWKEDKLKEVAKD